MCKTDTLEEAIEYDKNAIGVFKSGDKETLVGHLPVSSLLTTFLKAAPENNLDAIVARKRKRDVGLVVPEKLVALMKNETFSNMFLKILREKKKKKHPNFEFDIITTTVTNSATKCKTVDII